MVATPGWLRFLSAESDNICLKIKCAVLDVSVVLIGLVVVSGLQVGLKQTSSQNSKASAE